MRFLRRPTSIGSGPAGGESSTFVDLEIAGEDWPYSLASKVGLRSLFLYEMLVKDESTDQCTNDAEHGRQKKFKGSRQNADLLEVRRIHSE